MTETNVNFEAWIFSFYLPATNQVITKADCPPSKKKTKKTKKKKKKRNNLVNK